MQNRNNPLWVNIDAKCSLNMSRSLNTKTGLIMIFILNELIQL